jgi:hypothetical protein
MKRGLVFGVILIVSIILIASLLIAEGNNTSNSTQDNSTSNDQTNNTSNSNENQTNTTNQNETQTNATNQTNNTTTQCLENKDCQQGYECEEGFCTLDHNNEDENETDDDNERKEENKVCCMIIKTEDENQTEIEYDFKDANDCSKNETKKTREIVENSFCKIERLEKHEFKEKNRIKFEDKTGVECPEECTCTGRVMKCQLASGREMIIFAGKSGNIIIQMQGVNISTNVTIYKENETIYGNFSGKTKEIKILPDQVREKIREKIKTKLENEDIQLDENGFYRIEGKKKSRLFFIFQVKEKTQVEVNSENGEITKLKNPWWGFLAKDSKD